MNPTLPFALLAPLVASAPLAQDGTPSAGDQDAGASSAEEEAPPGATQAEAPSDALVLRTAALERWLPSPKDQGLVHALRLLDDRLGDLPEELDGDEAPAGLLPLLAALVDGPLGMRVGMNPEGADVPFALRFELGDSANGRELGEHVRTLLAADGMALGEPDDSGRYELPAPFPSWFRGGSEGFTLSVGGVDGDGIAIPAESGLPEGVETDAYLRLDYGVLFEEMLPMLSALSGETVSEEIPLDLVTSLDLEMFLGRDTTRSYLRTVMHDWSDSPYGALADETLPPGALDVVPRDATWASVAAYDLHSLASIYAETIELAARSQSGFAGPLPSLGDLIALPDFELGRDVLAHLGPVQGMYASDTTGGGGLLSSVAFSAVRDADALRAGLARLTEQLDEIARAETDGYVQMHVASSLSAAYGLQVTTLRFPGLPVPVSPSFAVTDEYLFLGLSEQGVRSAAAHVASGDAGLTANESFRAQSSGTAPGRLDGLVNLSFFDSPRLLREGYGRAALVATTLANAVRSKADPARDPGSILPPYPVLADGALATVGRGWVEDGDLVTELVGDASFLVNATAAGGYFSEIYGLAFVAGLASSLAAQNVTDAAGSAMQLQALDELAALRNALDEHAILHAGSYPASLDALDLDESARTDPWGRPYLYTPPEVDEEPFLICFGADGEPGGEDANTDLRPGMDPPAAPSDLQRRIEKLLE